DRTTKPFAWQLEVHQRCTSKELIIFLSKSFPKDLFQEKSRFFHTEFGIPNDVPLLHTAACTYIVKSASLKVILFLSFSPSSLSLSLSLPPIPEENGIFRLLRSL